MMQRRLLSLAALMATIACGLTAAPGVRADDEQAAEATPNVERVINVFVTGDESASSTWIGVMAVPVGEALEAQLKIEDRLIVQRVVPESPAAEAGIKQYDILLQFGDREIHQLDDLMDAVGANQGREVTVKVLRAGDEQSLVVKPTERPRDAIATIVREPQDAEKLGETIRRLVVTAQEAGSAAAAGEPLRLGIIGPAAVAGDHDVFRWMVQSTGELPENLTISVTKKGSSPAKIVVERDEEKWTTDEKNLEVLPVDVRPHVQRMLGMPRVAGAHIIAPGVPSPYQLKQFEVRPGIQLPKPGEAAVPPVEGRPQQTIRQRVQRVERASQAEVDDPLEALKTELKALKAEVENLKTQSAKPNADSESDQE